MTMDITIPLDAEAKEAAAITAAIRAHLVDEERADKGDESSMLDYWTFTGRISVSQIQAAPIPDGMPADAWTAAGRADRF